MKTGDFISQFEEIYAGKPWYGNSITEIFKGISEADAAQKLIPEGHSIVDLIYHMITWRYFAITQLRGDKDYDVQPNDKKDWREINYDNKNLLKDAISEFERIHKQLISELTNFDDDMLESVIPARDFTFNFLLTGLIQHDLYHLGQVSLLRSTLAK